MYVSLPLFLVFYLSCSISVVYHRLLFSLSLSTRSLRSLCLYVCSHFPCPIYSIYGTVWSCILPMICIFPLPLIFPRSIYFCVSFSFSSLFFLFLFRLVHFLLSVSLYLPTFPSPNILIPYVLHGMIIHFYHLYGSPPFSLLFVSFCPLSVCHTHSKRPVSFIHDFAFNMQSSGDRPSHTLK